MFRVTERRPSWRQQRGFALMVLLSLLVLGASAVFLAARNSDVGTREVASERRSATALGEALDALRMYNIDDNKLPGTLPCPDAHQPDDAQAGSASLLYGNDCPEYTARLPWRTLDSNRNAGRLWYVLDPAFRDNGDFRDPSAGEDPVNPELIGALTLDGRAGYAALVIDPGPPRAGQTDRGQGDESLTDFLEGSENTDGDTSFVNCVGIEACNDRIVGLTTDRLFAAVQRRVLAVVAERLKALAETEGNWPYAADFDDTGRCDPGREVGMLATDVGDDCLAGSTLTPAKFDPDDTWVIENRWPDLIYYHVDSACTAEGSGCADAALEVDGRTGFAVVLAGSGRPLGDEGQTRPGSNAADYLDHPDNIDPDTRYRDFPLGPTNNDAFRGVRDE